MNYLQPNQTLSVITYIKKITDRDKTIRIQTPIIGFSEQKKQKWVKKKINFKETSKKKQEFEDSLPMTFFNIIICNIFPKLDFELGISLETQKY
jgi:hypothetical protein